MKLPIKVVAAGTLLIALAVTGVYRRHRATPPPGPAASGEMAGREGFGSEQPVRVGRLALEGQSPDASAPATNWLQRLLGENGEGSELPPEALERWLASGRTNAADLLAARQAGGGAEYLRMALTNFPNDPRVLFAASGLDDGPEARRERLDRLKAVASDNALADYLSARDHFQNSRPEQAVADLLAASGKTHFQDYALDAMQNAEELYLQAGKSPAEAKVLGGSSTLLPHLAQLKGLAQDLIGLERQYLADGDVASAENLAQMGVQLGEQLSTGEGSRFLINQLVGTAVEQIVLRALEGQQNYDFLQGSASDYLAQLDARRAAAKQDARFVEAWMPTATELDLISYLDRIKLYGESRAMAWLRQRQGGQ